MTIAKNMLSPHFSLGELCRSAVALRHGISNNPGPQEIANLTSLATHILEPVRQHFSTPFSPSSGYRTPLLNRLVGSKTTSQHVMGQAADFEIPTVANWDLANWIRNNLTFDQLILEFYQLDDPQSGWVHCSYHTGHNRKMCLIFDGTDYKAF